MKRVLLQGPDCKVWYLGKRVYGWHEGGHLRRVPVPPPHGMFHTHMLRGDALDEAWSKEDADEFRDRSKRRYSKFARTHLLQRVGPVASTSQAPAKAPDF